MVSPYGMRRSSFQTASWNSVPLRLRSRSKTLRLPEKYSASWVSTARWSAAALGGAVPCAAEGGGAPPKVTSVNLPSSSTTIVKGPIGECTVTIVKYPHRQTFRGEPGENLSEGLWTVIARRRGARRDRGVVPRHPQARPATRQRGNDPADAAAPGPRQVPGPSRQQLPRLPLRADHGLRLPAQAGPRGGERFHLEQRDRLPRHPRRGEYHSRPRDRPRQLDRRRDPPGHARGRRSRRQRALPDHAVRPLPQSVRRGREVDRGLPAHPPA